MPIFPNQNQSLLFTLFTEVNIFFIFHQSKFTPLLSHIESTTVVCSFKKLCDNQYFGATYDWCPCNIVH